MNEDVKKSVMDVFDERKQKACGASEAKISMIQLMKRTLRECAYSCAELIADAVIADGWIKPICRIGDKIYIVFDDPDDGRLTFDEYIINDVSQKHIFLSCCNSNDIYDSVSVDEIGESAFFCREEAERAIKERSTS